MPRASHHLRGKMLWISIPFFVAVEIDHARLLEEVFHALALQEHIEFTIHS
jgi:hypothetical protein